MHISVPGGIALVLLCLGFVSPGCARGADAADIYLFAGQSNMWGTGNGPTDLPPELATIDENVRLLVLTDKAVPGESVPLQNGVNNNWATGAWGCEAQLMHRLSAAAAKKLIYVLRPARGEPHPY